MPDYLLVMHDDTVADAPDWQPYLDKLRQTGCFHGGSAIGEGVCVRKSGVPAPVTAHLGSMLNPSSVESINTPNAVPADGPP